METHLRFCSAGTCSVCYSLGRSCGQSHTLHWGLQLIGVNLDGCKKRGDFLKILRLCVNQNAATGLGHKTSFSVDGQLRQFLQAEEPLGKTRQTWQGRRKVIGAHLSRAHRAR